MMTFFCRPEAKPKLLQITQLAQPTHPNPTTTTTGTHTRPRGPRFCHLPGLPLVFLAGLPTRLPAHTSDLRSRRAVLPKPTQPAPLNKTTKPAPKHRSTSTRSMSSTSSSSSIRAPAPSPPSHDDPTTGPGASLQGVSAHGLVSLERAEHILQRVIDTVNDQGLQISSLYLLLQTLVGTETNPLPRSLLNVEGNFSRLNQRLEHVEKAIHVPGIAPSVSIGEVVSTNGVELNHALDALHKKANQAEVEARQHKLEEEVAEVYAWAGARELVERLEESNRATRTQVQAMEAALGCKVDKAEMAGMEATLNRLKVFNSRMEGLEQRQAQDMVGVRAEVQLLQERRVAAEQQLEVTRKALGALEEKHGAWKRETLELLKEVGGW